MAATITVTNTNDSGAGSLRQAISDAAPGDTIVLLTSASPYAVTSAQLVINKNLTISGAGARGTVLDAMGNPHRVLEISAGTVTLSGVTITGGSAKEGEEGGGILIDSAASLNVTESTIADNTVQPGPGSYGGGLYTRGSGALTVTASTVSGNLGYNGGGLYIAGTASITNSTIAGNHAGDTTHNGEGGGLESTGSTALANDTIAANESFNGHISGGGIDGTVGAVNTIIAENTDNLGDIDNCDGVVTSLGGNLENGSECGFAADGGVSEVKPLLTALADNGGPTETMAPLPGSPDLYDANPLSCPLKDQRGAERRTAAKPNCDQGAVEFGALADVSVSQVASPSPVTSGETLTYMVTVTNNGPGPDPAEQTLLTDVLPAGAALVSATASQGGACQGETTRAGCDLGTLASGASAQIAIAVRPTVAGAAINTASVNFAGLDPNQANNSSQLQTTVLAPAPTPPPPAPVSPTLSGLSETAKTWREGSLLAQISKNSNKPPVGTTFSFTLNGAANVSFTFTEPGGGRKVGKKCVAQTKKNRHERRCTRTVIAGTLTFTAHAGASKVHFEGRISKRTWLRPGSYTLLASATASGKHSPTRSLRFTIAPGRPAPAPEHFACSTPNTAKQPCYFSTPSGNIHCAWTPTTNTVTCELLATKQAYELGATGHAKAVKVTLTRRGETLPTNQLLTFPENLGCDSTNTSMFCGQAYGAGEFKLSPQGSHAA